MIGRPPPDTGLGITKNIDPTLGLVSQNLLPDPPECTFVRRGQECITLLGREYQSVRFPTLGLHLNPLKGRECITILLFINSREIQYEVKIRKDGGRADMRNVNIGRI